MCLHFLFLLTLEVWKWGSVSWLSLSSNSGSVEMLKCGNVEICLRCLYLITLQVCKCGKLEMCLSYPGPGGGVLPYKRLMAMCRWMGSHFHDGNDYNGVVFSIE